MPPGAGRSPNKQSNITRRRTGCIPCRDKRVRCDEQKPACRRCERTSSECVWNREIKIVFHDPDATKRSPQERSNSTDDDYYARPSLFTKRSSRSMDLTPNTDKSVTFDKSHQLTRTLSQVSQLTPTTSNEDEIERPYHPPPTPQNTDLASLSLVNTPQPLEPNAEQFTDWASLEASELVQQAIRTELEVTLMHNYLVECAPWFDAHSAQLWYSRIGVQRMLRCPPWRAAALALSAKNIELRERRTLTPGSESLPLHLYQLAVRLAIEAMGGRFEVVGTVAGCVLLCVYEMMTVTYFDWHRHVQGCASIYTHNGWNGSTGGLISGSFWDYARIDIWAAFCASTRTVWPPETYFDQPQAIADMVEVDEDFHAQIAIWLTARVVNLINDNPPISQSTDYPSLSAALRNWEAMGSETTRPIVTKSANAETDHPFPRILLGSHSSIIGHTHHNTSMVLLLEYEIAQGDIAAEVLKNQAYQHAIKAAGIIETNNHTACLVNSLQPAFVAGRHMRTRSEKFATLELLAQIEKKTGWKCGWRSDGLRQFWNVC